MHEINKKPEPRWWALWEWAHPVQALVVLSFVAVFVLFMAIMMISLVATLITNGHL